MASENNVVREGAQRPFKYRCEKVNVFSLTDGS
jgi:hypothetical protein